LFLCPFFLGTAGVSRAGLAHPSVFLGPAPPSWESDPTRRSGDSSNRPSLVRSLIRISRSQFASGYPYQLSLETSFGLMILVSSFVSVFPGSRKMRPPDTWLRCPSSTRITFEEVSDYSQPSLATSSRARSYRPLGSKYLTQRVQYFASGDRTVLSDSRPAH